MRRVDQLHAITDVTLQSASLTANRLGFTKTRAAAADYFVRLFR